MGCPSWLGLLRHPSKARAWDMPPPPCVFQGPRHRTPAKAAEAKADWVGLNTFPETGPGRPKAPPSAALAPPVKGLICCSGPWKQPLEAFRGLRNVRFTQSPGRAKVLTYHDPGPLWPSGSLWWPPGVGWGPPNLVRRCQGSK